MEPLPSGAAVGVQREPLVLSAVPGFRLQWRAFIKILLQ